MAVQASKDDTPEDGYCEMYRRAVGCHGFENFNLNLEDADREPEPEPERLALVDRVERHRSSFS